MGDAVRMEWPASPRGGARERDYRVTTVRVVDPDDLALLAETSDDALTLITCYPFSNSPISPQRFVVRAAPLGPSRAAATEGSGTR